MLYKEANTLVATEDFSREYFTLHDHIYKNAPFIGSRNGGTRELLNFKTVVENPIKRCVGGYGRNINIFFLLAEAAWIFVGRRDVAFLNIFNSNMSNYSDDGKYFHAPYGWRIRNYGPDSMEHYDEENLHASQGLDQLQLAIELLSKNPEDRRVVMSIWNPWLDLAKQSKDLPCNDIVMYKIRDNKLCQTIGNRSNDLNWGLTTNIFQFSFIGEIMSKILDIGLGVQVHNSQSLHIYMQEDLTNKLQLNIEKNYNSEHLYDLANPLEMDFNFTSSEFTNGRLTEVDYYLKGIIAVCMNRYTFKEGQEADFTAFEEELLHFSKYLHTVHFLLKKYIDYKKKKVNKQEAYNDICTYSRSYGIVNADIIVLAKNFFAARIGYNNEGSAKIGKY